MSAAVVEMRRPVIAEDDGIREVHGCKTRSDNTIVISEVGDCIKVAMMVSDRHITPSQARYLARKLYRLARRIDRREVA